jgi:hypothetical protein
MTDNNAASSASSGNTTTNPTLVASTSPSSSRFAVRNVTDLVPYAHNSRTHGEAQIAQIAASIKEFGFTNPVLIDEHDTIIAGEGRVQAAKKLKMETVPCIVLIGLTEAQKAAYAIADNKIALNAGWDDETLLAELGRIAELDCELSLTGFSEVEIAALQEEVSVGSEELEVELFGPQSATDTPEPGAVELQPAVAAPTAGACAAPQGAIGQQPHLAQSQAQTAWQGMPECNQQDAEPFHTIKVHFDDQVAYDAFAKLIGRKLTDKTKSVWYPERAKAATEGVYA